jgi:FMN-dependent NADH-azoreductase
MSALYVNACVRPDSRTDRIARELIARLGGDWREIRLAEENLRPLSAERLEERTQRIAAKDYAADTFRWAKQFAQADEIVIAAPYWDWSFPSLLKVYLENVYVIGIVSEYGEDGVPHGLCKAKKLYYVTTAGGEYLPDFSYDYIRALATVCFGIPQTALIKAEMLDVQGFDPEAIVRRAIDGLGKTICG